jgi:2-polyprenyl-3-methyl-5-hydroxy-6-metoxy-1,4-benzoquinol methylase
VVNRNIVEVETVAWGPARVAEIDLELLSDLTRMTRAECLHRLATYRLEDMAAEWRRWNPKTGQDIRSFYAKTDNYLWELLGWNGSAVYEPYMRRLDQLAALWPSATHPRALDYGCGVGNAALRLAELGYQVTLADVPGLTLDFARARFAQRGIAVGVVNVTDELPRLESRQWNVLVSFDVIEHLPNPAHVMKRLIRALTPGGGAAIVAGFDEHGDPWPHHLQQGWERFGGRRWDIFLSGLGMQCVGDSVYRRTAGLGDIGRRLRYRFWRTTGLYVERIA